MNESMTNVSVSVFLTNESTTNVSELRDRYDKTFTVDSVLTTKPTPMIYSDNHLRDITPILASTASGVLSKVDATLMLRSTETFTVDSFIKKFDVQTAKVDAFLRTEQTKTFTVDSFIRTSNTFNFTIDSQIEKEFTKTLTLDAFVQKEFVETFT